MCSRYFLDADGNVIAYTFTVPVDERIRPRFNIAPTQEAPVIRAAKDGGREVAMLRWGLVPFWAKDPKIGHKMINARGETVLEKPAFRNAFASRRCIVPASGFFEWTGAPGAKLPHAITLADRPLIAMAGLWERWRDAPGVPLETYTILTTPASQFMSAIHDRMPLILETADIDAWLSGPLDEARELVKPYAGEAMREREVNRLLNNPRNDSAELLL
ncbi:MAG TPA: SOS response-associated peptidase [Usitatibacter sp.]|nr:SOS response-associated peptidase [Usitatibacter sp.]